MATITPGAQCPMCGKSHRAGSKPLAACMAKLAEAEAPEAPRATVTPEATPNVGVYRKGVTTTSANGLRLLLAARKSRKAREGDATDNDMHSMYERQDHRAEQWADRAGHAIVARTADIKSGTSAPWTRKNLKPYMTRPELLARYDAILISDTDRLSRGTDEDFHWIETWCYQNGKRILVADGPQFPPREGPMGDSDRYQWIAQKRAARTYWEATRDKHADTREIIRANGAAIGKPMFGYRITGVKLHKTFEIDPVTGPLAKEAFQRIANGRTATSVAEYLTEATGKLWRVKRVLDMIKRTSYLGNRDGHTYQPLITQALWDSANAALSARSIATGGRRGTHAYSGVIHCACGAPMYHHYTGRGNAHYRCSRGRRGIAGETKCDYPALVFDAANTAIDALMRDNGAWPWVTVTTGGDAARQAELAKIKADMSKAVANGDMASLGQLSARFTLLDNAPAEPIVTKTVRQLDKSVGEVWAEATLTDQRAMLAERIITVSLRDDGTIEALDETDVYTFPEEAA